MSQSKVAEQRGFTIIELMIATTIFSLVLLIALAGIVQITKMYYSGVTRARTQNAARSIIDEVSESIRFSAEAFAPGYTVTGPDIDLGDNDVGYFCLGAKRYTYAIDRQLDSSLPDAPPAPSTKHKKHVLWVDQPTAGCGGSSAQLDVDNPSAPEAAADIDGRELLSENMRLTRFEITDITPSGAQPTYRISVGVAYGDDDLLSVKGASKTCEGVFTGAEFCAVSNLSVTVTKRL